MASPARDIPPRTARDGAADCAAELARLIALLRTLDPADWDRPTDCTEWTVRDVTAHVLGQFEGIARPWVFLRRYRSGHRNHPGLGRLDAMTRQQVNDLRGYPPEDLVDRLEDIGARAMRAIHRIPGPIRAINVTRYFPEDPLPEPSLGYFFDVIGARDTWMHRVDIAVATGRTPEPADRDAYVVGQVMREIGRDWTGPPVILELTGPAGGRWSLGDAGPDAPVARADTVQYLRALSGRVPARIDISGAEADALSAARAVF